MSIKMRLMMMLLVACLSVVAAGGIGLYSLRGCNAQLEALYKERMSKIMLISDIMSLMRDNRIQLLLALQHDPGNITIAKLHDHPLHMHFEVVEKNIVAVSEAWNAFSQLRTGEEGKRLADDFAAKRLKFVKEGLLPVKAAIEAGNYTDATELTLKNINPLFKPADEAAKVLYNQQIKQAKAAYEDAQSGYRRNFVLVGVGMLIAIVASLTLGLAILRSVSCATQALLTASKAMANGDLTARTTLKTNDELGEVARSFDQMADIFADLISHVTSSATQVAVAAEQVLGTAEQIATGAEEVAAQSATVATAGEEMAATSSDIARNCQGAADGAHIAAETTRKGFEVVKHTVSGIRGRGVKTQENAQIVSTLGERSDQIGAIVATIEDIADQTNLLALNAAIEAARAGEMGRGFAVVADEVRALAERTTKATKEISDMIRTIQAETRQAIISMEDGVKGTQQGAAEAELLEGALQDILHRVSDVTDQINQIATAAEEQTATTSEISNNMMQITDVVQSTALGAHESATAARILSENAQKLQLLVGKFRC